VITRSAWPTTCSAMPTIWTDMPHFLLKLVAPRPTFANDMNDQEKAMMQEHFL
jgi:hypothetical protein